MTQIHTTLLYSVQNIVSRYDFSDMIKKKFVRLCQNLRNVKKKRQANFKDFKRFGVFKGLVKQKKVVFNSFVCHLGFLALVRL
jgi:hypothetical protein